MELEIVEVDLNDEETLLHVQENAMWMNGPGCDCKFCALFWELNNGGYYKDYVLDGRKVRLIRKKNKK